MEKSDFYKGKSFINFQFWISFIYISYETPQAETCEQEDLTTICIVKTTEGFLVLNQDNLNRN